MSRQQRVTNQQLKNELPMIQAAVILHTKAFLKESGQEGASPKAVSMAKYVAGGGFGCKSKTVRKMMELCLGEKLPIINAIPGEMVCLVRTGTATMTTVDNAPMIVTNNATSHGHLILASIGGGKTEGQSYANFNIGTEEDIDLWFVIIDRLLERAPMDQGMHNKSALKALYLKWEKYGTSDAG